MRYGLVLVFDRGHLFSGFFFFFLDGWDVFVGWRTTTVSTHYL